MMLAAFAEAARALKRDDYRQIAVRNAEFALREMRTPEGRLYRTWKDGRGAKLNGYLEDYTHLAEGLLEVYQATFDARWFLAARELMEAALAHFTSDDGVFYDTSDDHEMLVTRPRDVQDNAMPSGNAMAATVLLKLAAYTGEGRYAETAEALLGKLQDKFRQYPTAFGQWLVAFEFAVGSPKEIALVGDPGATDMREMLDVIFEGFRPEPGRGAQSTGRITARAVAGGPRADRGKGDRLRVPALHLPDAGDGSANSGGTTTCLNWRTGPPESAPCAPTSAHGRRAT